MTLCSPTRTINLSPRGQDVPSCGSQLLKCKSFDYALELATTTTAKTKTTTSLRLVLETHPTKRFRYPVGNKTHLLYGNLTNLYIIKEQPGQLHPNPVLYAPLVATSGGVLFRVSKNSRQVSTTIKIDVLFVDLINIELLSTQHQRQQSSSAKADVVGFKVNLALQYMTIRNSKQAILNLNLLGGSMIIFYKCTLLGTQSSASIRLKAVASPASGRNEETHVDIQSSEIACPTQLSSITFISINKCEFVDDRNNINDVDDQDQHQYFISVDHSKGFAIVDSSLKGRRGSLSSSLRHFATVTSTFMTVNSFTVNDTVFRPTTWSKGALFDIGQSSTASINSLSVNNVVARLGVLIKVHHSLSATVAFDQVTIRGCLFGLYFDVSGTTILTNLHIENCFGQGIAVLQDGSQLKRSLFVNNRVAKFLVQVRAHGDGIGMTGVRFQNNSGLFLVRIEKPTKNFTLKNCHFMGNTFQLHLVRVDGSSSVNLFDTAVTGNRVGVLFKVLDSSTITMRNALIERNRLTGIVFDLDDKSNVSVHHLMATGNTFILFARGLGGSTLVMNRVSYHGNMAKGEGQLTRFINSKLFVSNAVIVVNYTGVGGSIFNLQMISHFSSYNMSVSVTTASNSSRISIMRLNMRRRNPLASVTETTAAAGADHQQMQMNFSCPVNFFFDNKTHLDEAFMDYEVSCSACAKGTYSLEAGKMNILSQYGNKSWTYYIYDRFDNLRRRLEYRVHGFRVEETTLIRCEKCPPGGDCDTVIKSRRNFYGYRTKRNQLQFITCPPGYCCSSEDECTNFRSCSHQRTGRLCGQCKAGHQIGYTTNRCIESSTLCTSKGRRVVFWFYYFVSPVVLTLVLVFAKDLKAFLKRAFSSLKNHLCCGCKRRKKNDNKDSEEVDEDEDVSETNSQGVRDNAIQVNGNKQPVSQITSYSGIFSILVSFYQIKSLVKSTSLGEEELSEGLAFIDDIFNLRFIVMNTLDLYCPFLNLNTVSREIMRGYGVPAVMVLTVVLGLTLSKYPCNLLGRCLTTESTGIRRCCFTDTTSHRFYVGIYTVVAFCFKDIATVSLKLLNCVTVEGERVLYVSGNVICSPPEGGLWWQNMSLGILVIWVIPFPLAVVLSYSLVRQRIIAMWIFLVCLSFPIASPFVFIAITFYKRRQGIANVYVNEDAREHLEEIFEEPYKDHFWWWEGLKLVERLVLSAISVFVLDPLNRIFIMSVVLLVLAYLHFRLQPYKADMFVLYQLDIVSFMCLFFHLVVILIRTFVIVYGSPVKETFDFHLESVFTPLWYLVAYALVCKIRRKLKLL